VPENLIPLPRLPREIAKITANGRTRTYEECYKAAINCVIPVELSETGRYLFEAARLPEIAVSLGLPLAADCVTEAT
jgi:hypothetical protein